MAARPEWATQEPPAAAEIRLGTQGWSYTDWVGPFYPPGAKAGQFLHYYSQSFDTVELDTTFYAIPQQRTVEGWLGATPEGFLFTAKLPQVITHMKRLVNVEEDLAAFLASLEPLGDRLGALLVQLPPDFQHDERPALESFLNQLPPAYQFAVELRHRSWIRPDVLDLLRHHQVAWTIVDLYYMPRVAEATASFAYVRWLGDRRRIDRFDRVQVDRLTQMERWAEILRNLSPHVDRIYGYYNNHYAGHSPASVREMRRLLGMPEVTDPVAAAEPQQSLFDDLDE